VRKLASVRSAKYASTADLEFTCKKGKEIYGEKEPADYVYQVKKGAVRSYKLLSDGDG
jgi:CRP/FNR family nitrogen fixation transcriptional regulator